MQITLRASAYAGPNARPQPIPIEPFAVNKEMGRVLVRRNGETIGAGGSLSFGSLYPLTQVSSGIILTIES